MLPCCEEETREEGDRRKILEQELAEQLTRMEKMEDEMQQTEDQKRRMEVNMQARETQGEKDLAAKEEVPEQKRHGMAKQLRDIETKMDEEREQKQAEQRTRREEMEDELRQTEDQNKDLYELKKKKAKMQGVMVKANNTARSSAMDKEREEKRHRMTKQPMAVESMLDEVRE